MSENISTAADNSVQGPEDKRGLYTLNKRFSFTTPDGTITEAGRVLINDYFYNATPRRDEDWLAIDANKGNSVGTIARLPEQWHWAWESKKSDPLAYEDYVGKFPKRVARWIKKQNNITAPAEWLEKLGNIAKDNSSSPLTYYFDFVDKIEWRAGQFGDNGSCWWGAYSDARETLIKGGGLAVRFFADDKIQTPMESVNNGIGRAWLAPFGDEGRYILFNGYGFRGDSTLIAARVLAQFLGVSYRKIPMSNHNTIMYLNSENGYLLGPRDEITVVTRADLKIGPKVVSCCNCSERMNDGTQVIAPNGNEYCQRCFDRLWKKCDGCGELHQVSLMTTIEGFGSFCEATIPLDKVKKCESCGRYHKIESFTHIEEKDYCERCRERYFYQCSDCKGWVRGSQIEAKIIRNEDNIPVRRIYLCRNCLPPTQQQMPLKNLRRNEPRSPFSPYQDRNEPQRIDFYTYIHNTVNGFVPMAHPFPQNEQETRDDDSDSKRQS